MSASRPLLGGLGFRGKEKEWVVTGGLGPSGLNCQQVFCIDPLNHSITELTFNKIAVVFNLGWGRGMYMDLLVYVSVELLMKDCPYLCV